MSLLLITNPPTTLALSSDWTTFVDRSDAGMLGHGLSIPIFTLTNWDATTTKPEIASGSIIEVGGSFYQADADTALTDESGLVDGTVHIKLVPAGGGASVVPTLTNDSLATWSANKAGWYDSDDKFLPYEMEKASAVYTEKNDIIHQSGAKAIFPVGYVYTQYPTKKTPSELGFLGTWTNISSDFEGDFFRAEGGNASTFESGEQGDAIRNITASAKPWTSVGFISATGSVGSVSGAFERGTSYGNSPATIGSTGSALNFDASNVVPTAAENRPINHTIRLWERTA